MRIIAGSARGIPLKTPKTTLRPTSDRVREAVFSILGDILPGARVLDLFAGSGSLGIEALSRGAESATFVEENRAACQAIRANLEKARLTGGHVITQEVERFLRGPRSAFDMIFADPPYAKHEDSENLAFALLDGDALVEFAADEACLILEVAHPSPQPETSLWQSVDYRHYGATGIWFLQKK